VNWTGILLALIILATIPSTIFFVRWLDRRDSTRADQIKQDEIERSRAKAVEMERRLNMIPGRGFDSDVLTDEERALLSTWVTATEAIMSNDQARQLANLLGGIFAKLEAEAVGDGRD